MEENITAQNKDQESKENFTEESKIKNQNYKLNKEIKNIQEKEIETVVNQLMKTVSGVSEDKSNVGKIKNNLYDILQNVGISGYAHEIKKEIKNNKKEISKLENVVEDFNLNLKGTETKKGIIQSNRENRDQLYELMDVLETNYKAKDDLEKDVFKIEEKIETLSEPEDKLLLQKNLYKVKQEKENIEDEIYNLEDEFSELKSEILRNEEQIDDKKSRIHEYKKSIRNHKYQTKTYESFLGQEKEIRNYIFANKLMKSNDLKTKRLYNKNELIQTNDYAIRKTISSKESEEPLSNTGISKLRKSDNLEYKQSRKDNRESIRDSFKKLFD